MSIKRKRVQQLLEINSTIFDYYLKENFSNEDQTNLFEQIEKTNEFLFHYSYLYLNSQKKTSFFSFGLIIDSIRNQFHFD